MSLLTGAADYYDDSEQQQQQQQQLDYANDYANNPFYDAVRNGDVDLNDLYQQQNMAENGYNNMQYDPSYYSDDEYRAAPMSRERFLQYYESME